MIHIENNTCSICLQEGLSWNLNYSKTEMEMFKCGHGTCKNCYKKMKTENSFSCPLCRGDEQQYKIGFLTQTVNKWTTFSEWYDEFDIFIKSGTANNIIKNTTFGQQLYRLMKENKKLLRENTKSQNPNLSRKSQSQRNSLIS